MEETINTQESTDQKFNICPCCGKPTLPNPVKPDQLLVDHWLSCMITGVPFTHTYPMYGGKIKLTISMLSADMDSALGTLLNMFNAIESMDDVVAKANANIMQMKAMAKLCACIKSIILQTAGGTSKVYQPADMIGLALNEFLPIRTDILTKQNNDQLVDKLKKVMLLLTSSDTVSAVPVELLATAVETHRQLNNILMNSGFDENFWEGIKLA